MAESAATKPIKTAITSDDGIDLSIIELFFFAYRDFTSDPDQILAEHVLGICHQLGEHSVEFVDPSPRDHRLRLSRGLIHHCPE